MSCRMLRSLETLGAQSSLQDGQIFAASGSIRFCPPSCPWATASPTLKLIVPKMLNTDQPGFAEQQKSVDNIHCLISLLYLARSNNVEHAIFPLMLKKHLVNKFVVSNINVISDGSQNARADEAFTASGGCYYGGCT